MAEGGGRCAVIVVFVGVTVAISKLFNEIQPEPYMDEIFHVPQAQTYCRNNFTHWDNKITTLPGLYVISLMLLHVRQFLHIESFFGEKELCSTIFLRFLNVLFMFGNFWLLYELSYAIQIENFTKCTKDEVQIQEAKTSKKQKKNVKDKSQTITKNQGLSVEKYQKDIENKSELTSKSFANAFVLSSFPLLYFFTFLYYTDQGSTFMVLVMYWLSLQGSFTTSALTGAVAVIFRQTNIIWVAFVAGVSLLRMIEKDLSCINDGLYKFISNLCYAVIVRLNAIFSVAFPYFCTVLAFGVFVFKNNGIVVGDRSSHQACFNLPQILYFIGFTMLMSFPMFFSPHIIMKQIQRVKQTLTDKAKMFLLAAVVIVLVFAISKLTYVHQYLLADNRHLTFYIWRKIYERHWTFKYLAIPLYLHGAYIMLAKMNVSKSGLWILIYFVAVCLVTIPQKLLELRYFIIPYLIFRLHVPIPSALNLAIELAIYFVINTFTIGLFLYKPFYWENDLAEQRFMW